MSTSLASPTASTNSPARSRKSRIERAKAVLQVTVLENRWIPDSVKAGLFPKQAAFLAYEGREALYGGAAGGGKSAALLIAALQYIDSPGYSALLLRRTYAQLAKSDSILSKAKDWLLPHAPKVRYNGDEKKFTFPSGATLEFGHMDHEDAKINYQGGSWPFVGADETTQFTASMLAYPRTRQRRPTGSRIPVRWRGGTNPGGIGHDHIKERYIKTKDGRNPQTPDRQFFPAKLSDNPHIDQADYVKQLKESGIDGILLAQLLDGDWDAVAGGRFKPDWFGWIRPDPHSPDMVNLHTHHGELVERFNFRGCSRFQTCDPAASTSAAADYFVLSDWLLSPKANLCWWGCLRTKLEIPEQVTTCQRRYRQFRPAFVAVEEVANQRSLAQHLRRSTDPPMVVRSVTPGGKKKLEHALGAIVLASSGRVFLPEADAAFPLDDVVSEVTRFTGDDRVDAHDDICLIAGTMVETDAGAVAIERIIPGDRVLTRRGYRAVIAAGQTCASARVCEVRLSNGRSLTGTPAHRVYAIGKGWTRIDTLMSGDTVVSCEEKPSSTMAYNSFDTQTQSIVPRASTSGRSAKKRRGIYINRSGGTLTDRSQKDATFTTATRTMTTTTSATLSALLKRSITRLTTLQTALSLLVRLRRHGTKAKPEKSGTVSTGKLCVSLEGQPRSNVRGAGSRSSFPCPSARGKSSAQERAAHDTTERPGCTGSMRPASSAKRCSKPSSGKRRSSAPVRVSCVIAMPRREAVYNLAVEGDHEYFANGILTHNCDTLSYAAEVLPMVGAGTGGGGPMVWKPTGKVR